MLKGTIALIIIAVIVWVYLVTFHKLLKSWFKDFTKKED